MLSGWRAWLMAAMVACGGVAAAASPVELTAQPDVAPGVAAFPRIAAPSTPAAMSINQALAKADARVLVAAQSCKANVVAQGMETAGEPDWERDITVAMRGPDYLALAANDFMACGGAHPDGEFVVLVYDVRTGKPVNWLRLMPKSMGATASLDQAGDDTNIGLVAAPVLTN